MKARDLKMTKNLKHSGDFFERISHWFHTGSALAFLAQTTYKPPSQRAIGISHHDSVKTIAWPDLEL